MCDGFSEAAIIGAAMTAGTMAVDAAQESVKADAAAKAEEYQAAVACNQQTIDQQNAQTALDQAAAAEQQQRIKTAAGIGAQRAQLAANGVALDSGSALDVQSDGASLGEINALSIRNSGQQQAYGDLAQAMTAGAQAGLYDFNADVSQEQGDLGVAKTLLNDREKYGFPF